MSQIRIGIISDTHGWLDPAVKDVFSGVDCILHAGDIGQEHVIEELEAIAPVHVVRGNIDGGALRFYPLEVVIEIGGKRIALLHIAGSPSRPNARARALLSRENPDIFVVGHSHIPVVSRVHGALWINPGAAGRHGFHLERYAVKLYIAAKSGEISMERVILGSRSRRQEI